ncbi:TetR/AcrR family transcriptional regulator [Salinithrix halophila]|uniref:TetR/AcrR family transcriptional regulator n=1 Tax=Salinithrix halophila TaxID=1485204 RepID=A0ABV8JJJ8_9BACL
MSLREQKKQYNRTAILNTAGRLFFEQGYTKTTMAEVAKQSAVGVGTIYNYFPSKSDLLLNLFAAESDQLALEPASFCAHDSPVQCIQDWVRSMVDFFRLYPKAFWREVMQAFADNVDENRELRKGLFQWDYQFIDQTEKLIATLQTQKKLDTDFSAKEAAITLYSVLAFQLLAFIYEEVMTEEELEARLERQILFIFSEKTPATGE